MHDKMHSKQYNVHATLVDMCHVTFWNNLKIPLYINMVLTQYHDMTITVCSRCVCASHCHGMQSVLYLGYRQSCSQCCFFFVFFGLFFLFSARTFSTPRKKVWLMPAHISHLSSVFFCARHLNIVICVKRVKTWYFLCASQCCAIQHLLNMKCLI